MPKLLTLNIFIERSILKHGNTYDYSECKYVNIHTKVDIKCKKHGIFPQTPNKHIRGRGCPKCRAEKLSIMFRSNTEKFIEKAKLVHGDYYDYSNVEYINSGANVIITCPVHGDFEQIPSNHLRGAGCIDCGFEKTKNSLTSNTEEFIEKAKLLHDDYYDYSNVMYINSKERIIITCPDHGDFEQIPNNHLQGAGCLKCINKTESQLLSILEEVFHEYTIHDQVIVVSDGKLKIDFLIVELNLYIELDGPQHFIQVSNWDPPEKTQAHDLTKTMRVLEDGQSLVRIYQPWVASDTNNWLDKLKESIREYEKPTAVFIGPKQIDPEDKLNYVKHKEDLHFSKLLNKLYETKMVY